jgi:hypothetical protein
MTDVAKTQEDGEMKDMMSKWEDENGVAEDDDDDAAEVSDDEEAELTKFHRSLDIPDESFDHVVLGTSDVERSIEDFEKMTGVRPVYVISLNGLGTKSARGMYPCTFPIVLTLFSNNSIKLMESFASSFTLASKSPLKMPVFWRFSDRIPSRRQLSLAKVYQRSKLVRWSPYTTPSETRKPPPV